jgi:putative glycosyltransferase
MKLSIVTTLYRSESFVEAFIDKAIAAGEAHGGEFEIVLVDDGSPDNSGKLAASRATTDDRITVVQLARNFGHHAAALCAIEHARGDQVFLIDSDLEVEPAVLSVFREKMNATAADVVYGVQVERKGEFATRRLGALFWRLFNAVSDTKVPNDVTTERLMARSYVDALLQLGDKNVFMGGMFYWPGFRQEPVFVDKKPRPTASSYSIAKRVTLLVQAISSFSSVPLLMIFWLGVVVFGATAAYSIFLVVQKMLYPESVLSGFTMLAVLSAYSFGINFTALGIIGLYIHRIFRQVQDRPRYIVRRLIGRR